jgi:3-deoxy-D-manno-octulosonic-acid transferase
LVNGRISEHSYQGYRKVRLFTRRLLPQVDLLCAQSAMDADRLIALGADAAQLEVMGSAKYDVTRVDREGEEAARAVLHAAGIREGDLILMGGSTWPGEERVLLDVYKRYREKYDNLVLVLVPRHVERTGDVVREIEEAGLSCRFRSKIDEANPCEDRPEVFLIDTTGELKNFYPSASVIFVGKSLTQHGGQNIIEPAFFGKAIVVGPNMENFPVVINDFIDEGAIEQVPDAEVLATMVDALLGDTERRRELGRRAADVVEKKSGAIQATIKRIEERTKDL